jgi:hypothetical protein
MLDIENFCLLVISIVCTALSKTKAHVALQMVIRLLFLTQKRYRDTKISENGNNNTKY